MTASELPWDIARRVPWHVFTSPVRQWAVMPSFVVGEYLFIAGAVVAFAHAWAQGAARRRHVLAWVLALLAGTANDLTFMAMPLVNNFWQAQGTVMLTPRLPLYIPCVYVCFLYAPTVSVWRANLAPLPRAALTGLAAIAFYAPYDIVGAKFLWWTWHDTDPAIANRLLGAPIGSSMFVITIGAAFSWLLGRVVDKDPAASAATCAKGAALVCGLSTPLMMLQVTALRELDGGVPGPRGLVALIALFAGIAWVGRRRAPDAAPPVPAAGRPSDRFFRVALMIYFGTFVAIAGAFDPSTHRSTSLHQTYGPCHVQTTDITGMTRYAYLCADDFDEDFSFDCADALPAPGADWYTVCGRPHKSRGSWVSAVALLCLAGALLYTQLLGVAGLPLRATRGR
jgi:hypothetical protein